jgi:hypothetical protein
MSKLLIPCEPLQVLPTLATLIGLNEAIVVQQIHYWCENKRCEGKVIKGHKYIYASLKQWHDDNFPFWSIATIQRIISNCEHGKYIVSGRFSDDKLDQTKYYRVDYEYINLLSSNISTCDDVKRNTETTETETTTETTSTTKPPKTKPIRSLKQKNNDLIHNAVATVTLCPSGSFNGAVTSALKEENPEKDAEWIASEVKRRFGQGGLWYSVDFRGKKNQRPTPNQIISEWNRVLDFAENRATVKPVEHAEEW